MDNPILIGIIVGVIAAALGFLIGYVLRKKLAEKSIGSAESEAKRIIEDATKAAETAKKEKASHFNTRLLFFLKPFIAYKTVAAIINKNQKTTPGISLANSTDEVRIFRFSGMCTRSKLIIHTIISTGEIKASLLFLSENIAIIADAKVRTPQNVLLNRSWK